MKLMSVTQEEEEDEADFTEDEAGPIVVKGVSRTR
jgi:hypothetical protein